jgi:ribosome-associated translation inhibitor RaiA
VALNFLARGSLDSNEIVIDFIFTLAYVMHLDFIIEKISIDSEKVMTPIFDGENNPVHLSQMKHDANQLNAKLMHLDDFFQNYCRIETIYRLRNVAHIFLEEETWIGGIGVNRHEYSISDYFKVRITKNIDDVSKMLSHKKEAMAEHLHTLSTELQSHEERPVVNTALIDIEEELVTQIQKWKGKIDQREIEESLLNFDSNEDMLLALKLLNKLSYITYDNLKSLSKALFNRIKAELGKMDIKLCIFSYKGDITSGSAHTMKIFQEQNDLRRDLFVEGTPLASVEGKKVLLLLDDFIGSGNFFVQWFEENSSILSKFEKLYYAP